MKKVFKKENNDYYYLCILLIFLSTVTAVVGFLGIGFGPITSFQIAFYIIFSLFLLSAVLGRFNNSKRRAKMF